MDPFAWMDATAQAELVRRGEVDPVELVEAAIGRIERLNPTLNAVITAAYEQALRAARGPQPDGPFAGVPFLLKDLSGWYAGLRHTAGSAFLGDWVPPEDSEYMARLRRSGFIVLGKTNTPEFGSLPTTEPRRFGPTRNPWDPSRTPGGSSGGSAAAVASGMVPVAHASDGGGSIRIPAACCGVFGLKVSRGRQPLNPNPVGFSVEHVIARSVRDSAAILDCTAGAAPGDPFWAPAPDRPFAEQVGADPGRLRIAFSTASPLGTPVHADCVRAVEDAAALCADLGHWVEEGAPPLDGQRLWEAFMTLWNALTVHGVDTFARVLGRKPEPRFFEPVTWHFYQQGLRVTAGQYLAALAALQGISRSVAEFFRGYDVWLTPTVAAPPPPVGSLAASEDPVADLPDVMAWVAFTPLANATGQPAMSVPLHWNAQGLPVGTQFMGRFGDEATLLRLAGQLEVARPWAHRRPPVAAA